MVSVVFHCHHFFLPFFTLNSFVISSCLFTSILSIMYAFHQEQHFYALHMAQEEMLKAAREKSWVMTSSNEAGFVKLPNERILYTSPPRTSLQISATTTSTGAEPYSAKSDAGVVYISNQRVGASLLSRIFEAIY